MHNRPRVIPSIVVGLLSVLAARSIAAADWPTWRGDAARSGVTDEQLSTDLTLHWRLHLPNPQPAWPDEQGKVRFDVSYEPVAAGGRLLVPSMVDDSVAAYRLADGQLEWRFYADGPVRFAPVVHRDHVLFVSDDGYLYCLTAVRGSLVWKLRGGPQNRKVLGNDRLVSMWPARGAPVVYEDTVYWAAGIWPFMGTFVRAVDVRTGTPVWTNSGSGSDYIVQQHSSPAFSGVAPQGYLAVNASVLLVAGGRTVPAVYDRRTGRFLYYRPSDRELGKDRGGYDVLLGPDWFANHRAVYNLADGMPTIEAPIDIIAPQCVYGVSGKHLIASQPQVVRSVETTIDRKGAEKQTIKHEMPELWRTELPAGLTTIHIQAGNALLASDAGSRVALLSIPHSDAEPCRVQWESTVGDPVWRVLAADGRLIVVGHHGTISCFGPRSDGPPAPREVFDAPALDDRTGVPDATRQAVAAWLQHTAARAGYAIVDQPPDVETLAALAQATQFHIIALEEDAQQREALRRALRSRGLLGTRVAVVPDQLLTAGLPPYLADLIVTAAPWGPRPSAARDVAGCAELLRPYGGTAVWSCAVRDPAGMSASLATSMPEVQLEPVEGGLVLRRSGPLPGAGTWTHQNCDAANTLVSSDSRVKTPLGLLWFGGPSHQGVLPRHGHGPTPQVIGGRLVIEGRDILRSVDVYTGRLLWQRAFPNVGVFYDNTDHHPGANAIGGNYVCTADSVYLVWGQRCVRLDPATGATLAEFFLPPDASGERPYWGFIAVQGDALIAGSSPMLLLARGPGETIDKDDKEQLQRAMPLFSQFGEGSRRLVVLDRFDGRVRWARDAQYNFRHNAIAVGGGKVFCLDRMTEQRLAHYRRRGEVPAADFCLYALDIEDGRVVWQSTEQAFGTWLAYSEPHGLLLQAGSKNRDRADDEVGKGLAVFQAATGELVWRNDDEYGGPPLLYPDTIVTQGTAYHLQTGAVVQREHPLTGELMRWKFTRNHGCNTAIGCVNLLTFRSAAAGYFDLANDGGTGNWGGFRSGCTSNLLPADGVINAPDYTRTCICSYQNQCSLALVPMSDVETWTFNSIPSSGKRVTRLGINFGAPGDRKADDGTLWLDYPSVGGPSPDVPVSVAGDRLEYVRQHASLAPSSRWPWVFASGVRGVRHLQLRLASREEAGETLWTYTVRLYWRHVAPADLQGPRLGLRLQGQPPGADCRVLGQPDPGNGCLVQQWEQVTAGEFLELDVSGASPLDLATPRPLLCGIEVIQTDH